MERNNSYYTEDVNGVNPFIHRIIIVTSNSTKVSTIYKVMDIHASLDSTELWVI